MTSIETPRPTFLEPLALASPKASASQTTNSSPKDEQTPMSEPVDLSEHDAYMEEHYYKPMREEQKECANAFLLQEWNSLSFWENRLEMLQRLKWPYVKKKGWSADDVIAVELLNEEIEEAEKRILELQSDDDLSEEEC